MIGYAFCGSFCTIERSLRQMALLAERGEEIQPIVSERVYSTDTRFFEAKRLCLEIEGIAKRKIIHTVKDAEPLGAASPLDYLIIAPCTGNTLAKISHGVTDSAVTMAAKAHLRCDRPTLIAFASNDAMSQNLSSLATLLSRKSVFFVPLLQDDPTEKPHSLVAKMEMIPAAFDEMKRGIQMRPLFLTK